MHIHIYTRLVYAFIYSRLHYIRTTYPCYCPLTEGPAAFVHICCISFSDYKIEPSFSPKSTTKNEFCIFVAFLSLVTRLNLLFLQNPPLKIHCAFSGNPYKLYLSNAVWRLPPRHTGLSIYDIRMYNDNYMIHMMKMGTQLHIKRKIL